MEEKEEEVSYSWPEWLPNGRFPESTVIKLMTYFDEKGFSVFSEEEFEFLSKEFSHFIYQLELLASVYAQKKNFDKFSKFSSGKQIKEILGAMKELSLKLKDAHNDTLLRIRIDSDRLGRKRYGKSINHFQMNKLEGLESCLNHIIYAIEQKGYSQKAIEDNGKGRPPNPEDHEFVINVRQALGGYLKKMPINAQVQETIEIILMQKGALKHTIDYTKDPLSFF